MDELLEQITVEINRITTKLEIDTFCSENEKKRLRKKLDTLLERRKTVQEVAEQYKRERD